MKNKVRSEKRTHRSGGLLIALRSKFKIGSRGFTLIEALVAMSVLVVGIVGLQAVMRRGLVTSVRAWDKEKKTNIALARIEEHKAQLFSNYQPNMPLPIVVPVPKPGATPSVDFQGNTLIFASIVNISLNAETNQITAVPSYAVTFPTPSISPTYYYGIVATPTPSSGKAWISPNGRAVCDQSAGNIYINAVVPAGVKGMLTLTFVDYLNASRIQSVWMDGLTRASFGAGDMSATPTVPTSMTIPVNSFDSGDGVLKLRIQQLGLPNNWGIPIEDGTNNSSMTINCGALAASPTPTSTPTVSGCINNDCDQIFPNNSHDSGDWDVTCNNAGNNCSFHTDGPSGNYYEVFAVPCAGVYKVSSRVSATTNGGGDRSVKVTMTGASITNNYGAAGATCIWSPNVNGNSDAPSYQIQDITHLGSGNNANPQYDPALWTIPASGNVTITFYGNNDNNGGYPRMRWLCLTRISSISYTPTRTNTPGGATPTRTSTPASVCSFPLTPTSRDSTTSAFDLYQGTPTYPYQQFGCDSNMLALTASGTANSTQKVIWNTASGLGTILENPAKIYANVRLMNGMACTMRVDTGSGPVTSAYGSISGASGWVTLVAPTSGSFAAQETINQVFFDFTGVSATAGVTSYLGVDSIRAVYDSPLNPNAILSSMTLSVLSSFTDNVTYAPYVVESNISPLDDPGQAKGYEIQVIVHDGRMSGPVSAVAVDKFRPVTIINSVSP